MQSLGCSYANGLLRRGLAQRAFCRRLRLRNRPIRKFCTEQTEKVAQPAAESAGAGASGGANLAKASFISRRLFKFSLFFGSFFAAGYFLHEKELMYKEVMRKFEAFKGKTGKDDDKPSAFLNYIMMFWGWNRSWEPMRFINHMPKLIEFMGQDYPVEIRQAALVVIIQIVSFDPSVPNPFVYDKCIFKKRVLLDENYGEKFMQALYNNCSCTESPELMMMSFDLLTKYPMTPSKPSDALVEEVMSKEDAPRDIVYAALLRHQDPENAHGSIQFLKERTYKKFRLPEFEQIQRQMIKFRALEFALSLWQSNNPLMKNAAFQMIPILIADYPDADELKEFLGNDEQERRINCRAMEEVLLNLGQHHYHRKENMAALRCYEEIVKFGQLSAPLVFVMGQAQKSLGMLDEAKENLSMALRMSRGMFVEARWELAQVLLGEGTDESIEEACRHLHIITMERSHPKLTEIYFQLLFGLEKLKKYDEAYDRMQDLIKLKPNDPTANAEAGRLANLVQEYEEAETLLRKSLSLEPSSTETKYQLGLSLLNQGEIGEETQDLLKEVLKNRPDHVKSLQLLSRISIENRDWMGAIQHIDNILLMKPGLIGFMIQKAEIMERIFDLDGAFLMYGMIINQWEQRLKRDPEYFQNRSKEQAYLQKAHKRAKRLHISPAYQQYKSRWKSFCEENKGLPL